MLVVGILAVGGCGFDNEFVVGIWLDWLGLFCFVFRLWRCSGCGSGCWLVATDAAHLVMVCIRLSFELILF